MNFCYKCRATIEDESQKFCINCGANLTEREEKQTENSNIDLDSLYSLLDDSSKLSKITEDYEELMNPVSIIKP